VETEEERFMRLAYRRTVTCAPKAFKGWHSRKRGDAVQETLAKMWDLRATLVSRGGNPEPIIGSMIHYTIMFVILVSAAPRRHERLSIGNGSTAKDNCAPIASA